MYSKDTYILKNRKHESPDKLTKIYSIYSFKKSVLVKQFQTSDYRLIIIAARKRVNIAAAIPVRFVNTSPNSYRLKDNTKVKTILLFEINEVLRMVIHKRVPTKFNWKDITIDYVENNTSI